MGRWFYERIWPIRHPLTSPGCSCKSGQGKGTRIASGILSPMYPLEPTEFIDDESGVTLGAFLHSERSPRVSDQPKRVSRWRWRVVCRGFTPWSSSGRNHSCGLFALRSPKALLMHHRSITARWFVSAESKVVTLTEKCKFRKWKESGKA